jgi:hypothetical protein
VIRKLRILNVAAKRQEDLNQTFSSYLEFYIIILLDFNEEEIILLI